MMCLVCHCVDTVEDDIAILQIKNTRVFCNLDLHAQMSEQRKEQKLSFEFNELR